MLCVVMVTLYVFFLDFFLGGGSDGRMDRMTTMDQKGLKFKASYGLRRSEMRRTFLADFPS